MRLRLPLHQTERSATHFLTRQNVAVALAALAAVAGTFALLPVEVALLDLQLLYQLLPLEALVAVRGHGLGCAREPLACDLHARERKGSDTP